ncbi:hypothetical protein DFH27DRAFT_610496 [Peziza echinospora]|nr:hypothetical protein DFH27DRAFT_610496 [Peziza echinospora]
MKLSTTIALCLAALPILTAAVAVSNPDVTTLHRRDQLDGPAEPPIGQWPESILVKRKGGGGKSSGGSSSGGKSSGGKTTGGTTSGKTNSGGTSKGGSGVAPKFTTAGGKKVYPGGGGTPYKSGGKSKSGISPFLLPLAILPALFIGAWAFAVFSYPWSNPLIYNNLANDLNIPAIYNLTNPITLPVICLCEEYAVCGCDETHDDAFAKGILLDALADGGNGSVAQIRMYEGKYTLVINGTLPNGTTAASGSGSSSINSLSSVTRALQATALSIVVVAFGSLFAL